MHVKDKSLSERIYINHENGCVIVAKENNDDSYTFYSTNLSNNDPNNIDMASIKPIDDVIEYIQKNDLDINILSMKKTNTGGKVNGK